MIQTVLVTEDDEGLRERLAWCLLARGYRVVTSSDGYEALRAMLSTKIDLLLLDMRLPRIDGRRVLLRMSQDSKLARVAVLAMTGNPGNLPPEVPSILKPFDDEQLFGAVSAIIGDPYRRPSPRVPAEAIGDALHRCQPMPR